MDLSSKPVKQNLSGAPHGHTSLVFSQNISGMPKLSHITNNTLLVAWGTIIQIWHNFMVV
jgi:hypothetical protein